MKIIDTASEPATLALIGSMSIWHWLIVLAVVLLLFGGGGKIPRLMKDVGTGIKSFKKGLKDEDKTEGADDEAEAAKKLEQEPAVASSTTADSKNKTAAGS
ncbi:MAG: hypothetical protein Kilf2KO_21390 [Rhodospirillales bacterium]